MAKVYSADFSVDATTLYDVVLRSVSALGYKVDFVDRASGLLTFKTGMSWRSWEGQEMSVVVVPLSEGAARLQVTARRLGFQLIDWGEGGAIARRVLQAVDSELGQRQLA